jgi:heme/copper-type cytochrome/quinol oxidase subunit 2
MYTIAIFISVVLTLLLFVVGGIVGWIFSFYANNREESPFIHPEFLDSSGNILPDEIIAVRFTPKLNIEEDYYDTDDSNEEAEDYG